MGLAKCPNGHIYNPRRYGKICPYDIINLGQSRFLFVPLCGNNFSWGDLK